MRRIVALPLPKGWMACLDCAGPSALGTASFCNCRQGLQASCKKNLLKSAICNQGRRPSLHLKLAHLQDPRVPKREMSLCGATHWREI